MFRGGSPNIWGYVVVLVAFLLLAHIALRLGLSLCVPYRRRRPPRGTM